MKKTQGYELGGKVQSTHQMLQLSTRQVGLHQEGTAQAVDVCNLARREREGSRVEVEQHSQIFHLARRGQI